VGLPGIDILRELYNRGYDQGIPDSGDKLALRAAQHIHLLREQLAEALNALHVTSMLPTADKRELQAWAKDRRGAIVARLGDPVWLDIGYTEETPTE
jgi:hypothetical protein